MKVGGDAKVTTKKRLGLSVSIHLYQKLQKKAEYQGKTMNALCNDILWKYFEQNEFNMKSKKESS